jgi:hypothetical protein
MQKNRNSDGFQWDLSFLFYPKMQEGRGIKDKKNRKKPFPLPLKMK